MSLQLENVAVKRGRQPILHDISATLAAGQIVGLIGPNGTGKSTLINAIATLLPYSGKIRWQGSPIDIRRIGLMPQHSQVRAELSVLETVLLGSHEQLGLRTNSALLARATAILADFRIDHLHNRAITKLSGGQQQLVLLAQRLLRRPPLLLLDEATSALDIRHQMHVFERLQAYVAESGALVVIAIHDLNLAAQHTHSILMLDQGRVAAQGHFSDIITCDTLRRIYGIESEILTSARGRRAVIPVCPCREQTDDTANENTKNNEK